MTPDVNIIMLDLPGKEKEAVTENEDGSYTIIINSRLSYEGQFKAYQHAIHHIANEDFQKEEVQSIEMEAHALTIPMEVQRISPDRFLQKTKKIQQQLQQLEESMEIIRSIRGYNDFDLSENQQWFGDNL